MDLHCLEIHRKVHLMARLEEGVHNWGEFALNRSWGNKVLQGAAVKVQVGTSEDLSAPRVVGTQQTPVEEVRRRGPFLPVFAVGALGRAVDQAALYP